MTAPNEALPRIDWETFETFAESDYEVIDKPYRLFRNGEDTGLVILPYEMYATMKAAIGEPIDDA